MTRRVATLITGALMLAVLVVLALHAPVNYLELEPGPTYNTLGSSDGTQLITISGAPTSASAGQLRMLTVYEVSGLTTFDVIRGWLDKDKAVVPRELYYAPGQSDKQVEQQNKDEFAQSQNSAITAALRHEGYPVIVTVADVSAGDPAAGHLRTGDVITSVGGKPVLSSGDVGAYIQGVPPKSKVTIGYKRDGVPGTADITTADNNGKSFVGIKLGQTQPAPVKVKFALDSVGGPSAGMMFSLGIIDKLDPADLTGGRIIAGTGTLDDDGNVGAIGGIPQKMVAAYDAGARYFLAPAGNCAEVLRYPVKGLTVVKVNTLDDALNALTDIRTGKPTTSCTN